MIGDKLLQEPKTAKECQKILLDFKFSTWATSETDIINNAKRLVELNNEVYEKLHPDYFYIDTTKQIIAGSPINIHYDKNALCFEINGSEITDEEELNNIRDGLYSKNSPGE
jgi:hypothetical protein